ncbi:hypothetical protein BK006_00340 [bacterium CG10_49_38]|nr:MAG: hypothetical protein BK006_00340 [bacterium CG10_49_38]
MTSDCESELSNSFFDCFTVSSTSVTSNSSPWTAILATLPSLINPATSDKAIGGSAVWSATDEA